MSQCPNCKTKLSCGCQKRVAKDGKQVCTKCITTYNSQVLQNKQVQKNITITDESVNQVKTFKQALNTKFGS